MKNQQDINFQPTVRCPHCNKVNRPTLSGWGREGLNARAKTCKHCIQNYSVILYVATDKATRVVDGDVTGLKRKIASAKRRNKEYKKHLEVESLSLDATFAIMKIVHFEKIGTN